MATTATKSHSLSLSIVIGIAIGILAAILSSHVAIWLIAGIFVGIAPERSSARRNVPSAKQDSTQAMRCEVEQRSRRIKS